MIDPVFSGIVVQGKFRADEEKAFKEAFYHHEGKRVKVKIWRWRKERSTQENRYYHGVVVKLIAEHIGEEDPECVHDLLKGMFNYEIVVVAGDAEIKVPKSTATLSTVEFEEYLEKIRMWASKFLALYIPLPNEVM